MNSRTVLIMAAGTGGHIFPALSIARLLQAQGVNIAWLGTPAGMENQVLQGTGIPLYSLPVSGLRGKGKLALLKAPFMLLNSIWRAVQHVRRIGPCCVLGMGGYVTGPGGVASWLLRRPLIIHEQNAVAGLSNRLLAPLAQRILEAFPGTFKASPKVLCVGNPVRADIAAVGLEARPSYDGSRRLRLLVLGGSLGAAAINDVVPELLSQNAVQGRLDIWHQTGKGKYESTMARYASVGQGLDDNLKVAPFIDDMAAAYRWADLVLCRSGAGTVFELAASGRPSLLVPYLHAVDDHQTRNADWLVAAGAAMLLPQRELDCDSLMQIIMGFLDNAVSLDAMARAAYGQAMPDAADKLASVCLEVCNEG